MVNRTAWTGGNLFSGLAFNPAFNAADIASMPNGNSVLSSITPFTNGTSLDQFMDISVVLTCASTAIAAGANLGIWLAILQEDGTTLGDGTLVAGTDAAVTPVWTPIAAIPLFASTRTTLIGSVTGILIPPRTFALILQNNAGPATAASGNACSISTYNQDLNH